MRIIYVLCLILIPTLSFAITFTPQERAYISAHKTITVCVDPDWYPYEAVNEKGEYYGIAADLMRLVCKRTGLNFRVYKTANWNETIKASKMGKCDVISFLNETPARDGWLIFTQPHFTDVNVFITRQDHAYIADLSALDRETLVFPAGTAMEELVRSKYPNLRYINTQDENEAFEAVADGRADIAMRSLIVAAYTIRKKGYFNLKVAGQLPYFTNKLRMGVLRDEPVLRDILDKGIDTITPIEKERIINSHVSIEVHKGMDYRLFYKIAGVFGIVILVSLFWALRLKTLNRKLLILSSTDTLTGINNRSKISEILDSEYDRAERYDRPISVIILDIDHFKNVNDSYGHQTGDKVLKHFAALAKSCLRASDSIGRWGGEEFMVICPETSIEEAFTVAERIREKTASSETAGISITVSAGVTEKTGDDCTDMMITRADTALYMAKNGGRNRVSCQ